MDFGLDEFPHYVVEVLENDKLNIPKYHSFLARKENGYDFKNPMKLIDTFNFKKIEDKNVTIVYRFFEQSLAEAKSKILSIESPIEKPDLEKDFYIEEIEILKKKINELEKKDRDSRKELKRLENLIDIIVEQQNMNPNSVMTVSLNYLLPFHWFNIYFPVSRPFQKRVFKYLAAYYQGQFTIQIILLALNCYYQQLIYGLLNLEKHFPPFQMI